MSPLGHGPSRDFIDRAEHLLTVRRPKQAKEEVMRHLGANPDDPRGYFMLGRICLVERKFDDAKTAARTAIGLAPDWFAPHFLLAKVFLNLDKYEEARKALAEAIRQEPEEPDLYGLMAVIHMLKGNLETAVRICDVGLKLDPENVDCRFSKAQALFHMGQKEEAEYLLRSILAIDPQHHDTQVMLADLDNQKGNHAAALPLVQNALRGLPTSVSAQEVYKESLRSQNRSYERLSYWNRQLLGKNTIWIILVLFLVYSVPSMVIYFVTATKPMWSNSLPIVLVCFIAAAMTIGLASVVLEGILKVKRGALNRGDPKLR